MRNIGLTIAFLCFISTFAYSQINVDVSSGFTYQLTRLSTAADTKNEFYLYVSPSFYMNELTRFRTSVQYTRGVSIFGGYNDYIVLSPEIEYDLFDFLSFGVGVFYAHDLKDGLIVSQEFSSLNIGPQAALKFRVKNVFATIKYNKSLVNEMYDVFMGRITFNTTTYSQGLLQFGLGYTFESK